MLQNGDVIFSWSGSFEVQLWNRGDAWLNQHLFRVIPKDGVDSKFLLHFLSWSIEPLSRQSHGTTMTHITRRVLLAYPINLPTHREQRSIAEILDSVDELILAGKLLIAKFQQSREGIVDSFFGQPENDNWNHISVAEVTTQITDGDHHTPQKAESGIPLLGAGNVLNGSLDLAEVDYVAEDEYRKMIRRCWPKQDDVLISCSGSVGRVARVPAGLRIALVRSVALLKVDRQVCLPEYLELVLRSPYVQRQIRNAQKQAAQPNLFQSAIARLTIPLPDIQGQKEIINRLHVYDDLLRTELGKVQKLGTLKHGLMDDLLTGRVRMR